MTFPYYLGNGQKREQQVAHLPIDRQVKKWMSSPEHYLADQGLVDACNVALLLGQPLLLTGEPGTGKTMFAYSLAWELGLPSPLKFETKSTSIARDLFYTCDNLQRFQDAQAGIAKSSLNYLSYRALGVAILRTLDIESIKNLVSSEFKHIGKQRSVVLIDEVDKAPRDFPNDILNEIENLYFRVSELGNVEIKADIALQPIVVITSNSEKDLPDAFLRRCIYYNIPFPQRDRLLEIITNRLGTFLGDSSEFLIDALDIFYILRQGGLRKKPAIAELLSWLIALQEITKGHENPITVPNAVQRTLGTLIKTAEDRERAIKIVDQWLETHITQNKLGFSQTNS